MIYPTKTDSRDLSLDKRKGIPEYFEFIPKPELMDLRHWLDKSLIEYKCVFDGFTNGNNPQKKSGPYYPKWVGYAVAKTEIPFVERIIASNKKDRPKLSEVIKQEILEIEIAKLERRNND